MNFGLNSLGSGLSLMRILGSVSRTLGIVRQVAPIYQNIKPLILKAPQFFARLYSLSGTAQKARNSIPQFTNARPNLSSKVTNDIEGGPVFFQ